MLKLGGRPSMCILLYISSSDLNHSLISQFQATKSREVIYLKDKCIVNWLSGVPLMSFSTDLISSMLMLILGGHACFGAQGRPNKRL